MRIQAVADTSLRRWIVLTLLVIVSSAQGEPAVHGFTATYTLKAGILSIGEMTRSLSVDSALSYAFESSISTSGIAALLRRVRIDETSIGQFRDGVVFSRYYSYDRDGKKKKKIETEFIHDDGIVIETYNGVESQYPVTQLLHDKLNYQLALMHDLQSAREPKSYSVIDRGRIKVYEVTRLGAEEIITATGRYDTVKFVRQKPGSDRRIVLWCAPELEFLPVRIEYHDKDGSKTTALLADYHRL